MYIASERDFEELLRTFGAKCDSAELPQINAYKFDLISTFSRSDDRMKELGQKVLGQILGIRVLCSGDLSHKLLVSRSWCNVHRQSSVHSCCEVCPKYTLLVSTSSAVFQDFDEPVKVVSERCFGLCSSTEFCTFV